jgi:sugar-specific transcriptional regulator TrmB
MEEPEALLKHLGLTEYEAKAILVLLKNGKCTADTISNVGIIPLPRVYDTMSGLAEKGLVFISKTRPQTFKTIDPKRLFELLKEDEKKKMDDRIKIIEDIAPQFLDKIKDIVKEDLGVRLDADFSLVRKKLNVEEIWSDLIKKTEKEFLIFAGDMSWIKRKEKEMKNAVRKKIVVRIISNKPSKDVVKIAKIAEKNGAEIRFFEDPSLVRGIISDRKIVYIIKKQKGSETSDYYSIIVTNEMIADVFRKYFYFLWEKSKALNYVSKRFK